MNIHKLLNPDTLLYSRTDGNRSCFRFYRGQEDEHEEYREMGGEWEDGGGRVGDFLMERYGTILVLWNAI